MGEEFNRREPTNIERIDQHPPMVNIFQIHQ